MKMFIPNEQQIKKIYDILETEQYNLYLLKNAVEIYLHNKKVKYKRIDSKSPNIEFESEQDFIFFKLIWLDI